MATVTITGWLIGRRCSLDQNLMALLTRIASFAVTGTLVNDWSVVLGVSPAFSGGRRIPNCACLSPEVASMDFKVGDIVRVEVQKEPYPEELGIIISIYPGFAWANYVRFPFAGKEMLISTRWLTKVGEALQ